MARIDSGRNQRRSPRTAPRPIGGTPPTAGQLRYLRYLAGKTGTDFAEHTSSAVAAAEIARLLRLL